MEDKKALFLKSEALLLKAMGGSDAPPEPAVLDFGEDITLSVSVVRGAADSSEPPRLVYRLEERCGQAEKGGYVQVDVVYGNRHASRRYLAVRGECSERFKALAGPLGLLFPDVSYRSESIGSDDVYHAVRKIMACVQQ